MKRYDPHQIEPKWQQIWADTKLYAAITGDRTRPKYYMLTEFPYPSGAGLHAGHIREYTLGDVIARHKRMQGYNVLYPMGYDAFGLPTENFAIKHKIRPQDATAQNVATFREQFNAMGFSFDWDRQVNTTDPAFYRWTQWLFLKFFEAGLAYQAEIAINWCPKEKTGLANEEVVDGKHERCGTPVEKKLLKQWMLKITDYADRLIDGLKTVDYPPRIADQQINWIGRSHGAEITFAVSRPDLSVTVYTTRPDTLFGATFLVISPEMAARWLETNWDAPAPVRAYVERALRESELERQEERQKTGVDTGLTASHPITADPLPIWVADYVLGSYGTGAIMAVPAHDDRDFEFARQHELPITEVIRPTGRNAVILHGCPDEGEEGEGKTDHKKHWLGWLKTQLESQNIPTATPQMPSPYTVHYADWKKIFDQLDVNEHTILIGHSCGGAFLVRWLAETHRQIHKLILVAPAKQHMDKRIDIYDFEIDLGVKNLTTNITIFLSDNESPSITKSAHKYAKALKAGITEVAGKGHFTLESMGTETFPELLDAALKVDNPYSGRGVLVNSGQFDGLVGDKAKAAITGHLQDKGAARPAKKYKLRDWIFSRQHYWGEPIPIIHCPKCGAVPVPEDQLPVELPDVEHYEPTDTGESPLAAIPSWLNTTCPQCGGPATRETDTMPNWAGSSWYYLRYMDAHNSEAFAGPDAMEYWGAVDLYLGGMEHTTLHLLYSRFWHQFLYDQGLVPTPEPYAARRGQGIVLAADGRKMSKSLGNVVNPTDIIARYGADALRLYIMFMAPYDETTPWSDERLAGVSRFIYRVHTLIQDLLANTNAGTTGPAQENTGELATAVDRATHKTIKKIHDDLENMRFNTVISALMEYVNFLSEAKIKAALAEPANADVAARTARNLLLLLAPAAPHVAEELWHDLGEQGSVHVAGWPKYDPELIKDDLVTVVVQVNGKVRANLVMPASATDAELTAAAQAEPNVAKFLSAGRITKTIVIPRKLVNFVVADS